MTRTTRKQKYTHTVRTKNYHKSKRTAQRADPTTNKPTRGSSGYRAPLEIKHWGERFLKTYPTYHKTGSQPPLALIQRKQEAIRKNKE